MADAVTERQKIASKEIAPPRRRPHRGPRALLRAVLFFAILALLAAAAYFAWKYFNTYESTDDAQIDGHINAISARINGYVSEVPVEDEQYVNAGDVLVRIDPQDYTVALANAQADLAAAEAALESSRSDIPITSSNTDSQLKNARSVRVDADASLVGAQRQLSAAEARLDTAQAQVREAEAAYKKAADDLARYKMLAAKDEIPQQVYDAAVSAADTAKATVDAPLLSAASLARKLSR